MSLHPLANIFAVTAEDPGVLQRIEEDMRRSGEFSVVWKPHSSWIVGSAPLPGEEPNPPAVRSEGFAFAEGQGCLNGTRDSLSRARKVVEQNPSQLVRYPGDFGFVFFHNDGNVTLVRSAAGLVPFYIRAGRQVTALGTRLSFFVRYLSDPPDIDPLTHAAWMTGHGFFPDNRTFLKGVEILPSGTFAFIKRHEVTRRDKYWDPRPDQISRPNAETEHHHAELLRELLIGNLARDLDPKGDNLLSLSGGVDSSSLLALAAGFAGRPTRYTVSIVPPSGQALEHERSFIDPLIERYGVERSWFIESRQEFLPDLLRKAPPTVFHVIHPVLCALPQVISEAPITVMFGGEFADHVVGSILRAPDWAAHTSFSRLLLELHRLPSDWKDPARWVRHRTLSAVGRPVLPLARKIPELVLQNVREQYSEWYERRRKAAGKDRRALRFLSLYHEHAGWSVMNWEATSQMGVRRSIPFFTREVLELAFQSHPAEQVGPGEKKILRKALDGYVPDRNLFRTDKGRWGRTMHRSQVRWRWEPLPDTAAQMFIEDVLPAPKIEIQPTEATNLSTFQMFSRALETARKEVKVA